MKILHTSDWHLGRSFGPVSLSGYQEQFCDELVDVVSSEGIDLLVVAGDIYDRAVAPRESIELFRTTMRRIRETGAMVAAITGNHDGPDRVATLGDVADPSGVYLRGGYEGIGGVITHEFHDGPLDIVLLPFLEPHAAPDTFGAEGAHPVDGDATGAGDDTEEALERRRRRTHASVLANAVSLAASNLSGARSLAVAHAFITGGAESDSERQLEVGGTGSVDAGLFDGFSYTALGHLHRPQDIGRATLRYCGTPMAYSFSEDHEKSLTVIDLSPTGDAKVTEIPLDVGRRVTTVRGTMAELLDPTRHPDATERFVRAVVTDRETVLDARSRLKEVYPHVVEVRLEPDGAPEELTGLTTPVKATTPFEATMGFWTEIEGSEPDGELRDVLQSAVTSAVAEATGVDQ